MPQQSLLLTADDAKGLSAHPISLHPTVLPKHANYIMYS